MSTLLSPNHQALQPHPSCRLSTPVALSAQVRWLDRQHLQVSYVLKSSSLREHWQIPDAQPSTPTDGLWQHTCFELFIASPGQNSYQEFNFSPSTQWAHFGFRSERVPDTRQYLGSEPPQITTRVESDGLILEVTLPRHSLPPSTAGWRYGLSAVLEDQFSQLSYWALHHPCPKPDFHHPDGRCRFLDIPTP